MMNMVVIQTSELLSSLYLIQRQIGASHNAYFKFYSSKKDGCIGNSFVCKMVIIIIPWLITKIKSIVVIIIIHDDHGNHVDHGHPGYDSGYVNDDHNNHSLYLGYNPKDDSS